MAQLGARFHGMEEVVGSIPTRSTKSLNGLARTAISALQFLPLVSISNPLSTDPLLSNSESDTDGAFWVGTSWRLVDGEDDGNGDYFCDLRLESMRAAIQAGCKL